MMKNQQEGEDTVMKFPSSPAYIEGGTMRDYQIRGLNWMIDLDSKVLQLRHGFWNIALALLRSMLPRTRRMMCST